MFKTLHEKICVLLDLTFDFQLGKYIGFSINSVHESIAFDFDPFLLHNLSDKCWWLFHNVDLEYWETTV